MINLVEDNLFFITARYFDNNIPKTNNLAETTIKQYQRRLKTIEGFQTIATSKNFLNMFITLFLGLIAIMATIRTANITSIVMIVIASLLVMFGLYGLSWSILGLAGLVAFISFLQEQSKT